MFAADSFNVCTNEITYTIMFYVITQFVSFIFNIVTSAHLGEVVGSNKDNEAEDQQINKEESKLEMETRATTPQVEDELDEENRMRDALSLEMEDITDQNQNEIEEPKEEELHVCDQEENMDANHEMKDDMEGQVIQTDLELVHVDLEQDNNNTEQIMKEKEKDEQKDTSQQKQRKRKEKQQLQLPDQKRQTRQNTFLPPWRKTIDPNNPLGL